MDNHDNFADPRAMTLTARRQAAALLAREQTQWLARLMALAEPPQPGPDFPAFLLATRPFLALGKALAQAKRRADLPLAVADELDWFVRAFRDYLRTADGEDVFSSSHRSLAR